MSNIFKKIIYGTIALSAIGFVSFVSLKDNKENDKQELQTKLITATRELNANKDLTCYSTYRKFYDAEISEGQDVSFNTVTDYVARLYQEGLDKYDEMGFDNLRVYRVYFDNFYEYWYRQSGFLDRSVDNISSARGDEIKAYYNNIVSYVEADNIASAENEIDALINELRADAVIMDSNELYAEVIEKSESGSGEVAKADFYLTYNQFIKAENPNGDKTITYTIVSKQIHNLLKEGLRRYKNEHDDYANYYKPFSNSYGYWYETSGFERKTMAYISGARVTAVELQFSAMKSAVATDKGYEEIENQVNALMEMLNTDAAKLDKLLGLNDSGSSSNGLAIATFFGCFTILVREGLEAILILGAIVAYLIKTNNKKQTKYVYIGALIAIAASFLLAWLLSLLNLTGIPQEIIEGVTALIAVAVLIYVSNWMFSKAESKAWTNYISSKVSDSVGKGRVIALAFTSFLAVFREGAEVILFYQPLIANAKDMTNGWLAVFGGMALGFVVVAIVFALIRIFSIKIPLKPFFLITSIFMALMAVVFLGSGIWELFIDGELANRLGMSTFIITPIAWMAENEILNFFGIYPTWLTIIPQLILIAVLVVTFILWIKKGKKEERQEDSTVKES